MARKTSAYENAATAIAVGGEVRNGPTSDHGLLTVASSLLAVAEAIHNLAAAVREGNEPLVETRAKGDDDR